MRPRLPPRSVQRVASFVAMNLLDRMQKRPDLDDETLAAVADRVECRPADDTKKRLADPNWAGTERCRGADRKRLYKTGGPIAKMLE